MARVALVQRHLADNTGFKALEPGTLPGLASGG